VDPPVISCRMDRDRAPAVAKPPNNDPAKFISP